MAKRVNKAEKDRRKDLAAKHWHAKRRNSCALSDVFTGERMETSFKLHEMAFLAGYQAAKSGK